MRQCKYLLFMWLLSGMILAPAQSLEPPGTQSPVSPADTQRDEQSKIEAAVARSKAHQDAQALEILNEVLAQDPGNATVNLLAAGAAIEELQMDLALKYAQKAQQVDPSDWKVHLSLLVADAGTGKLKERDQERELLRQFHADGKHPEAAASKGFMVEYFPLGNYRVRAIEYFAPVGKQHFSYRFLVYDGQRAQILAVALESDDLDQPSWAGAHKELAASGQREYSLEGYGTDTHTTYRSYSGKPSYDEVKAEVIKVLSQQASLTPAK